MWTRKDKKTGLKLVRIGKTKLQTCIWLMLIGVIGTAVLYPILKATQDPMPFWDSVITVASLIAEYMLCIKLLESWAVYFVADLISLVTLAVLALWVTFGTYLVFTALCVMGVVEWLKRFKKASEISVQVAVP
jgi:nicotinamide mononucleotide transporter